MDSANTYWDDRAALEWQVELGAVDAIGDAPLNRYELVTEAPKPKAVAKPAPAGKPVEVDAVAVAKAAASAAQDLAGLRGALAAFEHCELKRGARNLVFADGNPQARVMIIGEAPGRDEDRAGKPFVGRAGQLLDRMLAAIDLTRAGPDPASSVYITNILPWRPPQNRDPSFDEIAMLRPFVERHIELVAPDVIVLMGNIPCLALLGRKGITRMRGNWEVLLDRPALPMFHPDYLLRSPHAKREAWADLLALKAKLEEID